MTALHRDSVDKPEWFWRAALDDLGITFTTPWTSFIDVSGGPRVPALVQWRTAQCGNPLRRAARRRRRSLRSASRSIYEGDSGARREITFGELGAEVERVAARPAALGIGKGDRVGLFMPVIPEAAVALLACAKIGAVAVPAFSGYGPEPLAARLHAAEAMALITVDGTTRRGKRVADEGHRRCGSRRRSPASGMSLVVAQRRQRCRPMSMDAIATGPSLGSGRSAVPTVACDPNDPFMIIYTSGTTGAPKGIVHSHVGYLVKSGLDFGYAFDIQSDDRAGLDRRHGLDAGPADDRRRACSSAPASSSSRVCPTIPTDSRLWQIVERNRVTVLGIAPTAARGLRAATDGARAGRRTFPACAPSPRPAKPGTSRPGTGCSRRSAGKRLPILNYTGGTETGGGILSYYTIAPHVAGQLLPARCRAWTSTCSMPTANRPTASANSCMHNTWPGMTHAFWRDPERYLDTYWSRWDRRLGAWRPRQRGCATATGTSMAARTTRSRSRAAASARPRSSRRLSPTRRWRKPP